MQLFQKVIQYIRYIFYTVKKRGSKKTVDANA